MTITSTRTRKATLASQSPIAEKATATTPRRRGAKKSTASNGEQLYTIHSLDEIKIDTRVRRLDALDETEARKLTEQIQHTSVRLWLLVTEAHDRKAHLALGYDTWADYVKAELNMSESRSYQYLDTGHVMKALAAAGVDVEKQAPPPTRVVARVKDRLTDVKRVATAAASKGEDVDKAIRGLAREPQKRTPGAPRGLAAAQAAASKTTTTEPVVSSTQDAKNTATVQCPACKGSGRVERDLAGVIRDLMGKVRSG